MTLLAKGAPPDSFQIPWAVCASHSQQVYGRLARKIRYPSRSSARRGLRRLKAEGRDEVRVYRCSFCFGYHTTRSQA